MPRHQDAGSAATLNVKASKGRVFFVRGTNTNAAVQYLQLHNTATTPSASAVPQVWIPVPAGTAAAPAVVELGVDYFDDDGEWFGTGIAWAWSTTAATYTAATAAEHTTTVRYE